MPYGIKLLNNISQAALGVLPADAYVVGADTPAPDAIIVRSADMHEYERNRELIAIARAGAGVFTASICLLFGNRYAAKGFHTVMDWIGRLILKQDA
ncbi:MAG: hypothetical protein IJG56_00050 [Clostridia bacterium]|nr:hypothetical protein [Clostridia bacterium]